MHETYKRVMQIRSDLHHSPNWVAQLAAALLTIGSIGILLGWHLHLVPPDGWIKAWIASNSHVMLAMALTGLSLWLQLHPNRFAFTSVNRVVRVMAQILAVLAILLSLASLANISLVVDTVIDPLLQQWNLDDYTLQKNSMPFLSALCILLSASSLLFLDWKNSKNHYASEYCAAMLAAVVCIPLIGLLFNAHALTEVAPTPLPFLILSLGILFSRPTHPLMAVLFSDAPGGRLLRGVLPATLLLLVAMDVVGKWGATQGFYEHDMISPLVMLVGGGMLLILFWRAALLLNHEYGGRLQGEAVLAKANDLIRSVSDCTTDAIYVKDQKGCLVFANPAALKILDRDLPSALGRNSGELFADPMAAAIVETNNQAVLSSRKSQAVEVTLPTIDGVRTFYSTTAPWLGERGEVLGTVGIATDITDRKHTEDALKAHEVQLEALVQARTDEVRELIGHLETMREEEKRALARELHDDLGSSLTALNMHLAILFQQIPNDASITERTVQIKALLSSVTATTRRIQNGLRPDKLDIFGIKTAIADQAQDFENYTGVPCATSLPDEEVKYSTEVEISLFRMVQEALNNIAKHAKATHVDVILDDDDESIYLTVRDNGIGMSSESLPYHTAHGLRGMRERAAYLGGRIDVVSELGAGTKIQVVLPKPVMASIKPTEHTLKTAL